MKKLSILARWIARKELVRSLEIALFLEKEKNRKLNAKLEAERRAAIHDKYHGFIVGDGDLVKEIDALIARIHRAELSKEERKAVDKLFEDICRVHRADPRCA